MSWSWKRRASECLSVKIKDELKRTWSRETRIERHNKGHSNTAAPQLSGKYAEIAKAT